MRLSSPSTPARNATPKISTWGSRSRPAPLEAHAFERLDFRNLIEEIADKGRSQKRAIRNDLVVSHESAQVAESIPASSTSRAGSIVERRRRVREDIEDSPSLAGYPGEVFGAGTVPPGSKPRPPPDRRSPVFRKTSPGLSARYTSHSPIRYRANRKPPISTHQRHCAAIAAGCARAAPRPRAPSAAG
jgi:hypothetical protein